MAPKQKQTNLWVKAVSLVRYIDPETGMPLQNMRFVGRDPEGNVLSEGAVVGYHSFYIKQIKDGALAPMDLVTAGLAGVNFNK